MIICEHDEDQRYQFHDGAKNSTAGRMTFYELESKRRKSLRQGPSWCGCMGANGMILKI